MIWWIVGYFVIALVLAGLFVDNPDDGKDVSRNVFTSIFWPLIVVMTIVWYLVYLVSVAKNWIKDKQWR